MTLESVIIEHGKKRMMQFSTAEYRASLTRAFKDNGLSYVFLDSNPRNQEFLSACAAWAIDQDLLGIANVIQGEQYEVTILTLTSYGKRKILHNG